jgi:hypothetical protein
MRSMRWEVVAISNARTERLDAVDAGMYARVQALPELVGAG